MLYVFLFLPIMLWQFSTHDEYKSVWFVIT